MIPRSPRVDSKLEVAIVQFGLPELKDFFTLNISLTGMLIVSKNYVSVDPESPISVVIDPWQQQLSQFILCDVRVARIVDCNPESLKKYGHFLGPEISEISTAIGVYFDTILPDSLNNLGTFIDSIAPAA